jgi:hypothetical protein
VRACVRACVRAWCVCVYLLRLAPRLTQLVCVRVRVCPCSQTEELERQGNMRYPFDAAPGAVAARVANDAQGGLYLDTAATHNVFEALGVMTDIGHTECHTFEVAEGDVKLQDLAVVVTVKGQFDPRGYIIGRVAMSMHREALLGAAFSTVPILTHTPRFGTDPDDYTVDMGDLGLGDGPEANPALRSNAPFPPGRQRATAGDGAVPRDVLGDVMRGAGAGADADVIEAGLDFLAGGAEADLYARRPFGYAVAHELQLNTETTIGKIIIRHEPLCVPVTPGK